MFVHCDITYFCIFLVEFQIQPEIELVAFFIMIKLMIHNKNRASNSAEEMTRNAQMLGSDASVHKMLTGFEFELFDVVKIRLGRKLQSHSYPT